MDAINDRLLATGLRAAAVPAEVFAAKSPKLAPLLRVKTMQSDSVLDRLGGGLQRKAEVGPADMRHADF